VSRGRAALAALAALAAVGCATVPRPVPLPVRDPRPAARLAAFTEAVAGRRSLRGVAHLAIDGPAGSGRAKQILLVERPARLRVEVLGWLDQTVALLATDGHRYELYRARDRSWSEGAVTPDLLWQVAGLAVAPELAVQLLLAAPAPPADARVVGGALLPHGGVRAELAEAERGERLRYDFDGEGHLIAWSVLGADGEARIAAHWSDYRSVGAATFPF
jgi:hypothetical protein